MSKAAKKVVKKAGKKAGKKAFDPTVFLANLGPGKTNLKFRSGQTVYAQGDAADSVFYIQEGKVKLTVVSKEGKEAVVAILETGQFFGEGCLNGQTLRIATTKTMEDSQIVAITKKAMTATLENEPKFSELFVGYLLTRNNRIEEDLIDQLFNSRAAACAPAPAAGELRQGRQPAAYRHQDQSGNPGRHDRHHAFARKLLHEQVPQARLHQLQRED